MDTLYYCGFNGFKQVPSSRNHTLTTLVPHTASQGQNILDVAICWNYLVCVDGEGITKYGLVDGKNVCMRLTLPPGSDKVKQLSATPRHLLAVTENGECWTHEEGKGWRKVQVGAESSSPLVLPTTGTSSPSKIILPSSQSKTKEELLEDATQQSLSNEEDTNSESPLIDVRTSKEMSPEDTHSESDQGSRKASISDAATTDQESAPAVKSNSTKNLEFFADETQVTLVKTCCGDRHDLALDSEGLAYSLPSPLDFNPFPEISSNKVVDIVCGKEHCLLLTEHGQVYSWGGGSRGQLGHGSLNAEEKPRLIQALDGMRIRKIAAGGWHSACISQFDDLYMFGWNESGQLAQTTNLVKPAECFAAVEKLLMACCTMQPEDSANPRGDAEDCEVYHKNEDESSICETFQDPEKDVLSCYTAATSCNDTQNPDLVVVQSVPMLVQIPEDQGKVLDIGCGSRHTIVLTEGNGLWGFGWNKYGQLGMGHTLSRDSAEKICLPKALTKNSRVKMLRCGDWGTALVTTTKPKSK